MDTHVERLSKRFGMMPEEASYEAAHELLTDLVPDDSHYSLHKLLISHDRAYWVARNPDGENAICREFCWCEACERG